MRHIYRECNECPENYNLITNFKKEREHIFREAIKQFGWDGLTITEDAYWRNGTRDRTMFALRWKKVNEIRDLSGFWKIVEHIEGC